MPQPHPTAIGHANLARRSVVQAGALGLVGLGMNHVSALRSMGATSELKPPRARAVIYLFLSGGLGQHDSFDMKPDAPDNIRGEFNPIATNTPGIQICEHLPMLAKQSHLWSLVRSFSHPYPLHSQGHTAMLTGRTMMPPGYDPSAPRPSDFPSIAAIANAVTKPRNNLPPAIILPETLIHRTGRILPGQFAGEMGAHRNPMFLELCRFNSEAYGAYPTYAFHHAKGKVELTNFEFQAPNLSLPQDMSTERFRNRLKLLEHIKSQTAALEHAAESEAFDGQRQRAVGLLADKSVQSAFDVHKADAKALDRYGRNTFGWSCLMARQLVEAGVNLVQVNLGNNETWDNHGNAFPHLKDYLFPPTDRAVSALLEDLHDRGLLDSTLVVMAGEMGRTPRLSTLSQHYAKPGRDHWGTQTLFLAGGGVQGGRVVGATDKIGAYPTTMPQKPENLGATIYQALGLPREIHWQDQTGRPHYVYHGEPLAGLA